MREENDLPPEVDLTDENIDDADARTRLRRLMQGGLSKTLGYVLPIRRASGKREGEGWLSELGGSSAGALRRSGRLAAGPAAAAGLAAGAEAAGLSLHRSARSIRAARSAAGPPVARRPNIRSAGGHRQGKVPAVRTALTIQPRDGFLYVFMPPVARLEDYLELIAQLQAPRGPADPHRGLCAAADPRMDVLKVTPIRVIEVNVQPAASWREGWKSPAGSMPTRGPAAWGPTSS